MIFATLHDRLTHNYVQRTPTKYLPRAPTIPNPALHSTSPNIPPLHSVAATGLRALIQHKNTPIG